MMLYSLVPLAIILHISIMNASVVQQQKTSQVWIEATDDINGLLIFNGYPTNMRCVVKCAGQSYKYTVYHETLNTCG